MRRGSGRGSGLIKNWYGYRLHIDSSAVKARSVCNAAAEMIDDGGFAAKLLQRSIRYGVRHRRVGCDMYM